MGEIFLSYDAKLIRSEFSSTEATSALTNIRAELEEEPSEPSNDLAEERRQRLRLGRNLGSAALPKNESRHSTPVPQQKAKSRVRFLPLQNATSRRKSVCPLEALSKQRDPPWEAGAQLEISALSGLLNTLGEGPLNALG